MATLGLILGGLGTVVQTVGTLAAAGQQAAAYEFEAKQREQQADEAEAAGQRAAAARYREGRLIQSRQRAIAAATSGDVSDPSVITMMGDVSKETDLAARTEFYRAQQQAKGFTDAAKVARINASNARTSGMFSALGTAIGGASSMFARFGQSRSTSTTSQVQPLYG